MKIRRHLIVAFAALAASLFQGAVFGQESSPAVPTASSAATSFTLLLLGTRQQKDIEAIQKNLLAQPNIVSLVPSATSQGRLEFSGRFTGAAADLITDVRGLAVDRFDVTVHDDAARGLVLTLRKFREDFRAK